METPPHHMPEQSQGHGAQKNLFHLPVIQTQSPLLGETLLAMVGSTASLPLLNRIMLALFYFISI